MRTCASSLKGTAEKLEFLFSVRTAHSLGIRHSCFMSEGFCEQLYFLNLFYSILSYLFLFFSFFSNPHRSSVKFLIFHVIYCVAFPRISMEHFYVELKWIFFLDLSRTSSSSCRAASTDLSLSIYIYIYMLFIASGRSSRRHPMSIQNYCRYLFVGQPTLSRPYEGVYKRKLLMGSSLLL